MSIRTQNLVAILPLFLFLAVVSCALMLKIERDEVLWGLREEAGSLAGSLAEFMPAEALRGGSGLRAQGSGPGRLQTGDRSQDDEAAGRRLVFERILRQRQARRIVGLSADGRQVVFSQGEGETGTEVITAYAPVLDASGRRAGIVGVETDAGGVRALMRHLVRRSLAITGLVLLLGIGATLAISGIVAREVRGLTRAAVEVREGVFDRQMTRASPGYPAGRVQEIADLGNTFSTMRDVLKDFLAKSRRSLLDGDQFQASSDLAETYRDVFTPMVSTTVGTAQVVASHLGDRATGSFYAVCQAGETSCAIAGRVREGEGLDAVVAASAASALLQQQLARVEPEVALRRTADLFDVDRIELWIPGSGVWSVTGGSESIDCSAEPSMPFCFHTLGDDAGESIRRYLGVFRHLSAEELVADMVAVLPKDESGAVMIVAPCAASDDGSPSTEGGHSEEERI